MKIRLLLPIVGLVINFAVPTFAQQKEQTLNESIPEIPPTPTFVTQVLPDRRITFRLFSAHANAVQVLIGVKSSVHEFKGTTTTEMTKDLGTRKYRIGEPATCAEHQTCLYRHTRNP